MDTGVFEDFPDMKLKHLVALMFGCLIFIMIENIFNGFCGGTD